MANKRMVWSGVIALIVLAVLAAVGLRYRDLILSKLNISAANPDSSAALGLKPIADIALDGGSSRFDYQSIDDRQRLLFITHLGADKVSVFDLAQQKIITDITGLASPHGILVVPELGRAFVSATGSGQVAVIDTQTFQVIARVEAGQFPDGLAYDPDTHKLFVSDETGGADIVIDAQTNQPLGRIDLGGQVGNTQYDPDGHQILVAAQGSGQLDAIDSASAKVTERIDLPGCQGPHGFYVDSVSRRAFVSCEGNGRLVVVDLSAGRVTATDTVGDVPDVLAFDSGLHRLYVAAESGVVAVFDTSSPGLKKVGQTYLAPAAHTVAVDLQTYRVYFPLENINGQPALRIFEPVALPSP